MAADSCRLRGKADIDGLDFGIGEDVGEFAVALDGGEIELPAGAAEVALRGGEVAGKLALVGGEDGGQFGAFDLAQGAQVDAAHESESEHGDLHPLQGSKGIVSESAAGAE